MGKGGRGQARRGSPGRKDERGAAGVPGAAEEAGQANRGKGGAHSEVLREGAASCGKMERDSQAEGAARSEMMN